MIENSLQYEVTKKKQAQLQRALDERRAQSRPDNVPERVWRGHQNGILALISDLQTELDDYEKLKADPVPTCPA